MRRRWIRWAAAAALSPMLFGTTSQGESIHHGVPREPGNSIPDGSRSICAGVPDGVPFIPNLTTGFAIGDGSSQAVELMFSDQVLRCERRGTSGISDVADQLCTSAWQFSLTIPAELQQPGTYQLSNFPVDFEQSMSFGGGESGCGRCGASGGGTSGTTGGGPAGAGTGPRGGRGARRAPLEEGRRAYGRGLELRGGGRARASRRYAGGVRPLERARTALSDGQVPRIRRHQSGAAGVPMSPRRSNR